ncbi:maleate cis-trans isomerase family protein [Leisingera methylohalidivorans]|uniref:Arylmalonate decarboxylase n=1 Tax=Leisingera methylohalidivorans DSM 14336 TaxID=999552 RepID=V9VXS0_9RHOB|nr:arylmalonate decarboxylase [Leisingera methylohalidivorans]AHD02170.1 arylmalonate decarboxylase [Leisingera methylohalidivorans DSM 14336]
MSNFLGQRLRIGVAIPSTNTSAQPEMEDMRAFGVTNHIGRIIIDDDSLTHADGSNRVIENIRSATPDALRSLRHCGAGAIIAAVSPDGYWEGHAAHEALHGRLAEAAGGAKVILSADAILAALKALGGIRRIGLISPYLELGDEPVSRFFTDSGIEVAATHGLGGRTPSNISDVTPADLRDAVLAVDSPQVEAIVQVGTNVPMAAFAQAAEAWTGKPVLSNNAVLYWHALRSCGVTDPIPGRGVLYENH